MPTKSYLKTLLQKYNLKPNKLLGQNFLIDHGALNKIIIAAELTKNDTVLEVGPGLGILTRELAKRAKRVIAVEKDKRLAEVLQNILREERIENVEVIEGDILKIFNKFSISKFTKYKLVANIPYYLTSRLIRIFLEIANPPQTMVLLLQKEVAQRICAKPPKMSLLAVATQFYADVKIIATVPKTAFQPRPKVDSAIVKFSPFCHPDESQNPDIKKSGLRVKPACPVGRPGMTEKYGATVSQKRFFSVLRAGFSQPRKQLANNLSKALKTNRITIEKILNQLGFKNSVRAQELTVGDWIKLTEYFKNELK